MGEDVRQFRHFGEDDRLPQRLALCPVCECKTGAEKYQDDPGEDRAAGRRQKQAPRQQHRQAVEEKRRPPGGLGHGDPPRDQPRREREHAADRNLKRRAHLPAQAGWIRKR